MNALCVNVMYMSYYETRLKKMDKTLIQKSLETDCFNLSSQREKALWV